MRFILHITVDFISRDILLSLPPGFTGLEGIGTTRNHYKDNGQIIFPYLHSEFFLTGALILSKHQSELFIKN